MTTEHFEKVSEAESSCLEYKENTRSKTYLKTVSAFANYQNGTIRFGIKDDKTILGIPDPEQAALNIENQINDNIRPQPKYSVSFDPETGVISVDVKKGPYTPYRYDGKAYRRNGTSTIEVDGYELDKLILDVRNFEFCDLPAKNQNLTFDAFSAVWKKNFSLDISKDLLATLGSYGEEEGYTVTAELLSDQNSFPGISVVKFGQSINQIEVRNLFENESILSVSQKALDLILSLLSYEEITGILRVMKSKVPEVAVRETLINAIIHRDWNIPSPVQVEIHSDRLTILSPGGLPKSMTEKEYLCSNRSVPRNTQLTIVFLRLSLIERLGTGLRRVKDAYASDQVKPVFTIYPNSVCVELPFTNLSLSAGSDRKQILEILKQSGPCRRKEIQNRTGFSQTKTISLLKSLIEERCIEKIGSGPSTAYQLL